MKVDKSAVTLGADVGGRDAHAATEALVLALRRHLERECVGPYGEAFVEFALVVRVDGSVQSWGKRGVENVRLQRKSKYATADIFVPRDVWVEGPESVRTFLAGGVLAAVKAIVSRSEKTGDNVDRDLLVRDVARATEQFRCEGLRPDGGEVGE